MRKLFLTVIALQIVLNCFGQVTLPPIPDSWKVYVADRNQKKYLSRITPDETVNPVPGLDAEVKAAEGWLMGKGD